MAAREQDDFDVLKFFITVMALLTVFVTGYALYLRSQVTTLSSQIRSQVNLLVEMKKIAQDPQLKDWLARERESKQGDRSRTPSDFKALLIDASPRFNLQLTQYLQEPMIDHRVAQEIPFKIFVDGCRVEDLVRYLAYVEESWPGARTRLVHQLDWDEKRSSWKAQILISIFKASST